MVYADTRQTIESRLERLRSEVMSQICRMADHSMNIVEYKLALELRGSGKRLEKEA